MANYQLTAAIQHLGEVNTVVEFHADLYKLQSQSFFFKGIFNFMVPLIQYSEKKVVFREIKLMFGLKYLLLLKITSV